MIETGIDSLQLLGFTEEQAEEIRKNNLEKRRKAHEKASVPQKGFKEVYRRIKENE